MKKLHELSKQELIDEVLRLRNLNKEETSIPIEDKKYRETMEILSEGFYSVTIDGVLLDYNIEFCNILGLESGKSYIGIKLPDFWINPADRDQYIKELLSKGFIKNFKINAKRQDGNKIICQANSRLIKDKEGKPQRIDGTFIDITEKELALETLNENYHYYRSLLNQLREDIIVIDREYNIVDVNNTFLSSTGHLRDEVIGKHCYEISHGYKCSCDKMGEECKLKELFELKKPINYIHEHKQKDGTKIWVDILLSPLTNKNGEITNAIEAIRDISDIMETQKSLEESEEQYRLLADNSVDVIWRMDLKLNFTYVSPSIKDLTGFSQEEWLNTNLSEHASRREFFNMARSANFILNLNMIFVFKVKVCRRKT
jgi:PAS domain S-box-containing protein